jgi:hypothetical protein
MKPGRWAELCERAQFLLDFEFLSRHTHPGENRIRPTIVAQTACVYTQSPPYLNEIARQFPWVHFYAFQHIEPDSEYDPAQPALVSKSTAPSIQTDRNKTTATDAFTKESATALSRVKEDNQPSHSAVLICHGESLVQQLVFHTLLRADFSMLDIEGPIPAEYLDGDIVLPIQLPRDRVFACMVAHRTCRPTAYNPTLYLEEMCESRPTTKRVECDDNNREPNRDYAHAGFFQNMLRATSSYDTASTDLIISEYIHRFAWYHQVEPESGRQALRRVIDTLHSDHYY